MKKIEPANWITSDGLLLETNATEVVKSGYNSLVIAGPGAGKTELLAQRASYLLQTNTCKYPRKILAISFKADAATNLRERVVLRCGADLSKRFDSLTFDAFAKSLFDRFKTALPTEFKVKGIYGVALTDNPVLDSYRDKDEAYFNTTAKVDILKFFYMTLPFPKTNNIEKLKDAVWKSLLDQNKPNLSFKMIMRLAELVIKSNPIIKQYLQQTYQYVFLDEFQDTTDIQYDFLKSCFFNSPTIYTAVGDDKQRIMIWAGAKETAFYDFITDVNAVKVPLFMNFRSAPRLVALQNYLVQNLLHKQELATASSKWNDNDGECNIWVFRDVDHEQRRLLECVRKWIDEDEINPRQICILVKQSLNVYAGQLIEHFNQNGVKARDESELQNLLTEEVIVYLLNIFKSAFNKKLAHERIATMDFLISINGTIEVEDQLKLEIKLNRFQAQIVEIFNAGDKSISHFKGLIEEVVGFTETRKIKANFPIYKDNVYFTYLINTFCSLLQREFERNNDINIALNNVSGIDTIPVMTVHKSKGLEYHTVIFIGLEDSAFWTYQNQPDEDNCTFFVALSRAKERVVFTFSRTRPDRNGRLRNQNIDNIRAILNGLSDSGIATIEVIE